MRERNSRRNLLSAEVYHEEPGEDARITSPDELCRAQSLAVQFSILYCVAISAAEGVIQESVDFEH